MTKETMIKAQREKNDEFYTQICDIENELKYYRKKLAGKIVFLNCDDPKYSNFWKYFYLNFKELKLKKLIATHYRKDSGHIADLFEGYNKRAYVLEYDGAGKPSRTKLKEDGDFRSGECVELLKEANFVCTNPPFSLFGEYVAQLMEHKKKFLIMGNRNAIGYSEIFPLFKNDKMWLGYNNENEKWFQVPRNHYDKVKSENRKNIINGKYFVRMGTVCWWTNIDIEKKHKNMLLYEEYNEKDYPYYDNCENAIEVREYKKIPMDWPHRMGVPITFLSHHNPNQFHLVGYRKGDDGKDLRIKGKDKYMRLIIQRTE